MLVLVLVQGRLVTDAADEAALQPAREALATAMSEAQAAHNWQALGEAAFALCACVGESNGARAAELLNIYHSCKVSAQLRDLLLAGISS